MGDAQLFLVRVWQHLNQFRASVRAVDDEDPRLFTEPAQVAAYLAVAGSRDESTGGGHDEQNKDH